MRVAYADPPYPGMAHLYPEKAEVDHVELVAQLVEYDGWALSTAASTLQQVLSICPDDVRIGIWYRNNTKHPGNMGKWWWSWEAVIFSPVRQPAYVTRDFVSHHKEQGFLGGTIVGQKPVAVCYWIFALLGLLPDDELVDLFPGSNAVTKSWDRWRTQLCLETEGMVT